MPKRGRVYRCVHCGVVLGDVRPINPWLRWPTYECPMVQGGVPACVEGQEWYGRSTVVTAAGRGLRPEVEALPAGERV